MSYYYPGAAYTDYGQYSTNNTINPCCRYFNIRTKGIGILRTQPDMATVTLSIITENKDLKTAKEENDRRANQVINQIETLGIDDKDIQTINYSVNEIYDYIEGERVFKGYRITNSLKITVRDINTVGEVIDLAIEAGANEIRNISFALAQPNKYYKEALVLAIDDAISKAKKIGRTLGVVVNVIPTKVIEESSASNYQPIMEPVFRSPEDTTPIEPGEVQINASVIAEFSYI